MEFTHLQVRSAYSLLTSSIKIADYINLATSRDLKSLALVEDGTMHSAIKFYKACQLAGIKPIIGIRLNIKVDEFKDDWTLIAKNNKGYQALLKLASAAALEDGEVTIEDIITYSTDVIVITSGEQGFLASLIEQRQQEYLTQYYEQYLRQIKHLYIGLLRVNRQTYDLSQGLIYWAKSIGLKTVALNDVRYLEQEDAKTLTFLTAIKQNQSIKQIEIQDVERYFKTEDEMRTPVSYTH